jgi:hypothetical protein
MATKVEAAHALMVNAARLKDAGKRNDVEAGMAKLLASEYCVEVTQESFRIHGGYGYSKEYEIERLMREAPFLLIGEGTSEIQKTIISRGLLKEYRLRGLTQLDQGVAKCAKVPAVASSTVMPGTGQLQIVGSRASAVQCWNVEGIVVERTRACTCPAGTPGGLLVRVK